MTRRVIPFADRTGARVLPFGTTPDKWGRMTPRQRYKLNDGTLRARINEGDNFKYIGIDPSRDPLHRHNFDLTGSELLRLNDRGITFEIVPEDAVQSVLNGSR